jgi:site-specific DNA-methyltransferase (adenine-specific)
VSDWTVLHGDCLWWLRELPAASIDAVVTDPPYGLEFMGHDWDRFGDRRQPGDATFHRSGVGPFDRAKVRHGGYRSWDAERIARGAANDASSRTSLGPHSASRPGRAAPRSSTAFGNAAGHAGSFGRAPAAMRAFQEWCETCASEVLRVLKPGGYLLAFGGCRTYHRLAAGIEDAGFEIRDQIDWLFGSGFPKSRALAPGVGTALKPGHEPIVLARAPLVGSAQATYDAHETAGLNVGACRLETTSAGPGTTPAGDKNAGRTLEGGSLARQPYDGSAGRWPANVILDEDAAAELELAGQEECVARRGPDVGGASRFFYCAKAGTAERNAGLNDLPVSADPLTMSPTSTIHRGRVGGQRVDDHVPVRAPRANVHPTVKPIELMRWLCRLVTPPGGTVLDPFAGAGTTGCAAVLEGFDFVGIEREADYVAIAEARIGWWAEHPEGVELVDALDAARERLRRQQEGQLDLLGGAA